MIEPKFDLLKTLYVIQLFESPKNLYCPDGWVGRDIYLCFTFYVFYENVKKNHFFRYHFRKIFLRFLFFIYVYVQFHSLRFFYIFLIYVFLRYFMFTFFYVFYSVLRGPG